MDSLQLGSRTYTESELLLMLNLPTRGDASVILAKQLIAAELNIANGSDPAPVVGTIRHADALLSSFSIEFPYNVKPSSNIGKTMVEDANVLDSYNSGKFTTVVTP